MFRSHIHRMLGMMEMAAGWRRAHNENDKFYVDGVADLFNGSTRVNC